MNCLNQFNFIHFGPYLIQILEKWHTLGFQHGFIGKSGNFSSKSLAQELPRFLDTFEIGELVVLDQQHADVCLDFRSEDTTAGAADAIIVSRLSKHARRIAYGIKTADCLPIIVLGENEIALIHAGWRGLACGVIQSALSHFKPGEDLEIAIGPCASLERYEVGQEVIDAIGNIAEFKCHPTSENKRFLSLQGTARKIILGLRPNAQIAMSEICTMSDERFHSCRRDGPNFGSNLTFVLC